jgi:hypothetical protein
MFKKPSELWGDDPEMQKAESSKQTFVPFVFPELLLGEKVGDKVVPYNVFERLIDLIVKSAEGKAVLKATGFLDLDKIWQNSKHPQLESWRKYIPKGKTLNLAQMFPTPYSGRKLYYGFVLFVQDFVWESVETDQKDDKGNKIKKNTKKYLVDEKTQEPINRLGGFQPNKAPKKGGSIECYINSWQLEEKNERDDQGNVITVKGKEMVYWKSKGYIHDQKVVDWFIDIEKQAFEYQKTVDQTMDKVYLWFIIPELKAPAKDAKYPEYAGSVDYMVLPK